MAVMHNGAAHVIYALTLYGMWCWFILSGIGCVNENAAVVNDAQGSSGWELRHCRSSELFSAIKLVDLELHGDLIYESDSSRKAAEEETMFLNVGIPITTNVAGVALTAAGWMFRKSGDNLVASKWVTLAPDDVIIIRRASEDTNRRLRSALGILEDAPRPIKQMDQRYCYRKWCLAIRCSRNETLKFIALIDDAAK